MKLAYVRDGVVIWIAPKDKTADDFPDLRDYLRVVEDGVETNNTVDDAGARRVVVVVPQSVTPWQMRKALNVTGLRDAVETAVTGASQDMRDGWEFATEFRRDDPLIGAMGAALGKSAADLDALFALAASL